jgi:hypothetical protein
MDDEWKCPWPNIMVLLRYLSAGTEQNHEKPQSVYPVSLRAKILTRIQSRSAAALSFVFALSSQ